MSQSEKRAIRQQMRHLAHIKKYVSIGSNVMVRMIYRRYIEQKQHHARILQYWRF